MIESDQAETYLAPSPFGRDYYINGTGFPVLAESKRC